MGALRPEVRALFGPFPGGPTRGRARDWVRYRSRKVRERVARWVVRTPKALPHRHVLAAAVSRALSLFPVPVCLETGCIRNAREGTESTRVIASALQGRGRFYSFELDPAHIAICRAVCREFDGHIRYIQGDAKANLRKLRDDGTLRTVHFAFFDSASDPGQIWAEFRAVEDLFVPGSVVIVDDTVRGVKGSRIKPYLHRHPLWDTYLIYAANGMLVAVRRSEPLA